MTSSLSITSELMAGYLRGARDREAARTAACAARSERAWFAARSVATRLKAEYGASRVIVFGSLVSGAFSETSDIDIVVAGVPAAQFFRAWADVERIADGFEVDLVPLEDARPWVAAVLAADGVVL
jgi:predicted nucleotidyltransferase